MAEDIRTFAVTTAAGVAIATPTTTALTMPARVVREVRIRIPPGPRGNLGFRLALAGTAILPSNAGGFIVADDEAITWPLTNQPNSGAWQIQTYNLGINPHTLYVTFLLDLPQRGLAGAILPAPLAIEA